MVYKILFILASKLMWWHWFKLTVRSWLLWYLLQVDIALCRILWSLWSSHRYWEYVKKEKQLLEFIGINSNLNTKSLSLVAKASKLWTISRPVTPLPKICNQSKTERPKGMLSALYFDKKYLNMIFVYQKGLRNWISFINFN